MAGGNIQMIGKSNAEAMRGEKPKLTKLSPEWTLSDVAEHAVDFWLTTEDLPLPGNRVTTDKDGNVHLAYASTNDAEADRLYAELKKILNHTGMAEHHVLGKNFYMDMRHPGGRLRAPGGTCRFGTDPAPRCSTSTARRTNWTTSTWWTPVSSPASVR